MSFGARLVSVFSVLALLVVGAPASAGETAPRFKSGQYEQLMLAVDSQGR